MSELQPADGIVFDDDEVVVNESAAPKIIEDEPAEDQDQPDSASATDDTGDDQAVKFDEKQQAKVNELIAEKVKKQREAERKAERLAIELEQVRQQLPEHTRPVIPDAPDPLSLTDSEYKARLAQREEAIRKAAVFDARKQESERQAQQAQHDAEIARQEALAAEAENYVQRASRLGISQVELQAAGNIVGQFGIGHPNHPLTQFLLTDEQGPQIVKHLASDLVTLQHLAQLNPVQAAVMIATQIKPKLTAKQVNAPPEPVSRPRPSGSTRREYGPKGATYE
jgi:hypothetical protein